MKFKGMEVITNPNLRKDEVYFIPLASEEEIKAGHYVIFNGIKMSWNPNKYGVIKNIREEE